MFLFDLQQINHKKNKKKIGLTEIHCFRFIHLTFKLYHISKNDLTNALKLHPICYHKPPTMLMIRAILLPGLVYTPTHTKYQKKKVNHNNKKTQNQYKLTALPRM